ncbi:hypothetical protein MP228_012013 [Amoeboaphelidium protococcarum]|nr:hypothetical protein MP228_012013 [Amoeboaphelidium protococcarum]
MRNLRVEQVISEIGFGYSQIILLFLCGIGYTVGTMELLSATVLLPQLSKQLQSCKFPIGFIAEDHENCQPERLNLQSTLGLYQTVLFVGSLLGSFIWGLISDLYGRRIVFIYAPLISGLIGLISAISPSFGVLLIFRFICGIAQGGSLSIPFVMFMEFCPQSLRSHQTQAVITAFGVLGVFLTGALGFLVIESGGWRVYIIVVSSISILIAVLRMAWKWESPAFFAAKGRNTECLSVLQKMARFNRKSLEPYEFIHQSQSELGEQASNRYTVQFWKFYSVQSLLVLTRFIVIWFAITFGYYGVTIWLSKYFEQRGIASQRLYDSLMLISAAELPGLALIVVFITKFGLQRSLMFSLICCAASIVGFGFVTSSVGVIVANCFIYFFVVGAWCSLYILTPQSFPVQVRSLSFSLCSIGSTIAGSLAGPLGGYFLDRQIQITWLLVTYASCFALGSIVAFTMPISMQDREQATAELLDDHDEEVSDVEDTSPLILKNENVVE